MCRLRKSCRSSKKIIQPAGKPAEMTDETGWTVVAVLAILILLVVAVRTRLLAMFGYELSRIEPQRSTQDELRGAVDDFRRDGQMVREDRDRVGGLFDLAELEVSDIM